MRIEKVPGGWLNPEEVSELRRALRAERAATARRIEEARYQAQSFDALAISPDPLLAAGRLQHREAAATQRELQKMHAARAASLDVALDVFDGVEHGARIEALPPAEGGGGDGAG